MKDKNCDKFNKRKFFKNLAASTEENFSDFLKIAYLVFIFTYCKAIITKYDEN